MSNNTLIIDRPPITPDSPFANTPTPDPFIPNSVPYDERPAYIAARLERIAENRAGNYVICEAELAFEAKYGPVTDDRNVDVATVKLREMVDNFSVATGPQMYVRDQDEPIPTAPQRQVGGDHYSKLGAYQPWQVMAEWMTPEELRGFMKGTVIAYLAREQDKGGDQDIAKALHTMELFQEYRKDKK